MFTFIFGHFVWRDEPWRKAISRAMDKVRHMAFDEIESNKHDLTSWVETRLSQLIIFLYILI